MKAVFFSLVLSFMTSQSFAMSDIERAILFGANAASGGTFLPVMEAEMQKVKLEYEQKKAEFDLELEREQQKSLASLIDWELDLLTSYQKINEAQLSVVKEEQSAFRVVLRLTEGLYESSVTLDDVRYEISARAELVPNVDARWRELLKSSDISGEAHQLSVAEIKNLLLQAYDMNSQFDLLVNEYSSQATIIKAEIQGLNTRKAGLK